MNSSVHTVGRPQRQPADSGGDRGGIEAERNIFEEAELAPEATIRKFRIVRREGQREVVDFLGLHFTSVSRIMNQRSNMQRK
jgi:hypothetical protein